METHPGKGILKEEKFPNTRKLSHRWVHGGFWNLRGQHNWEENKNQKTPQMTRLIATPRGEVAQTLAFTTSQQVLNRDVGCMLRVRMGTECPEENLKELM